MRWMNPTALLRDAISKRKVNAMQDVGHVYWVPSCNIATNTKMGRETFDSKEPFAASGATFLSSALKKTISRASVF